MSIIVSLFLWIKLKIIGFHKVLNNAGKFIIYQAGEGVNVYF